MDEFNFFTEEEKKDAAYKACLIGTTATGAILGGLSSGPGAPAAVPIGAAAGFAWGLLVCKRLSEPIKRKIFSAQASINEDELLHVLQAIREIDPMISKQKALKSFAGIREEIKNKPLDFSQGKTA